MNRTVTTEIIRVGNYVGGNFPVTSMPAAHSPLLRLYVLDDHEIIQHAIRLRFSREPDVDVVDCFTHSRELLSALGRQPVDIVLCDFMLGPQDLDGVSLVRQIKARAPRTRVLVLTARATAATATLVLQAGAHGIVSKGCAMEEMIAAARWVGGGRIYVDEDIAADMATFSASSLRIGLEDTPEEGMDHVRLSALSPREHEVLLCCLEGMTVTQIASKFSRSNNTISSQKQSALRKLGISNDMELFRLRELLLG